MNPQNKFFILFGLILASVLIFSVTSFILLSSETQKHIQEKFDDQANTRGNSIQLLQSLRVNEIQLFSNHHLIQELSNIYFDDSSLMNSASFGELKEKLSSQIKKYQQENRDIENYNLNLYGFYDFKIIGTQGTVIYSTDRSLEGSDFSHNPGFISEMKNPHIVYDLDDAGNRAMMVTVPIKNNSNPSEILGVLIATMWTKTTDKILLDRNYIGETGEVYLVNKDYLMVSESRFMENLSFNQIVNSVAVAKCFDEGKNFSGIYLDYREISVYGSSFCMPEFGLVLLAEIDESEVIEPLIQEARLFVGMTATVSVIIVVASIISKRIAGKLEELLLVNESTKKLVELQLKELREADKLKDEFATMVSHELKTPLVPIKGYTEMLLDPDISKNLTSEQKTYVHEIYEHSEKLEILIGDVLDVQKLSLGHMEFNNNELNLGKFLTNILNYLTPFMVDKQIQLVIAPIKEMSINTDENRLYQVISNLVKNAVDFVPSSTGKIEVGINSEKDSITFYVKDNGIGIPKDKQKKLFKKFYQSDTSQKRQHGGTGLGLVICKGIVEGLGGKIWVESDGDGKGTTFYFTIPKN